MYVPLVQLTGSFPHIKEKKMTNTTNNNGTTISNEVKQTRLETSMSMAALDALIRTTVEATDISSLVNKYEQYMMKLEEVESKYKDFHMQLLTSIVPEKAITTLLRVLIKEGVTAYSYIDRNVVASKVGKKLLPKSAKKGSAVNRQIAALSLGLNLVNIAASMNLASYRGIINAEKHNISSLEINPNLIPHTLTHAAQQVRANTIMLCKPIPHTTKKQGGMITAGKTMLNSSGFNSVKLQSQSTCDAMNALQDVAYELRTNLTEEVLVQYTSEDKWFNEDGQFMQGEWNKLIADVKLAKEGPFYFAVSADDRGRLYELSAYLKYQGDKFQKSMLEFSKKEHCTDEGLTYLAIAICNELHDDKISFNDAVEWIDAREITELRELTKGNPIATTLVADYCDALQGKAIGTITHWDATNSGLQFYSLIGADRQTASLCNVFDTGSIADAYKALAVALNKATDTDSFNRSNVKNAFMVFLYGSMAKNILFKIEDKKNGVTAGIAEFFPEDWSEEAMWTTFTEAMEAIAPAAIKLMNLMYTYNTEGTTKFQWTMPDGFKVETTSVVSYSGTEDDDKNKQIKGWFIDLKGKTHEGSASIKLEEYAKFSRSLAPNIIHSIDSYFGREVIRRCASEGIEVSFIHDSFGVHPNNSARLHEIAREVAIMILESNLLEDILMELNPVQTQWNIKKGKLAKGTLTTADINNSSYILR